MLHAVMEWVCTECNATNSKPAIIFKNQYYQKILNKAIQITLDHNRYTTKTTDTSYINIQQVTPPPHVIAFGAVYGHW